jgi:hypothetical protein
MEQLEWLVPEPEQWAREGDLLVLTTTEDMAKTRATVPHLEARAATIRTA